MSPVTRLPALLPLFVHPTADPESWRAAERAAPGLTVVVRHPEDAAAASALARLRDAGVTVLGHVDVAFATDPVAEVLRRVRRWTGHRVTGVFLDQVPTSPFSAGPVVAAVRAARRAGMRTVLNPGTATDPLYRALGGPVCTFEGTWTEYWRWDTTGSRPGDGHLVHSVPRQSQAAAWALLRERGAGFGLVTEHTAPDPYGRAPAWLAGRSRWPGRRRARRHGAVATA